MKKQNLHIKLSHNKNIKQEKDYFPISPIKLGKKIIEINTGLKKVKKPIKIKISSRDTIDNNSKEFKIKLNLPTNSNFLDKKSKSLEYEHAFIDRFIAWTRETDYESSNSHIQAVLEFSRSELESSLKPEKTPLIERCPALMKWSPNKKEMEADNILNRIPTKGKKSGRKGSRLENAKEFIDRVFYDEKISKYPYLHEIRAINPHLGKSLDRLAYREKVDIREWIPVLDENPYKKHTEIKNT